MSLVYTQASSVLAPCLENSGNNKNATNSLRSRALASPSNQAATLALASQTLRYKSVIDELLNAIGIELSDILTNAALGYVLVYEVLFGLREIRGGGGAKRAIMNLKDSLCAALTQLKADKGYV